jgi:hypothetical protein
MRYHPLPHARQLVGQGVASKAQMIAQGLVERGTRG